MNIELTNFSDARILIVGDVMLDRYWQGSTARISPEAPVPIVHVKDISDRPGGASNVAVNVRALGGNAMLLGAIGNDDTADVLRSQLDEYQIEHRLQQVPDYPTISKVRVISQNQQLLRLDFEKPSSTINLEPIIAQYAALLDDTDVVVISDYGKGISTIAPALIKLANEKNKPILVDPKGNDFSIYAGATVITPNTKEFEAVVGSCADETEIETKGAALRRKHNFGAVLITRGAKGMSLIQKDQPSAHIPTHARDVFDVTGAGDTVVATLAAALAAKQSLLEATTLANIAAGIVVRKLGAATASIPELRTSLQKRQESWLGIINEHALLQETATARTRGETIVMTNGCFDILHAGHIAYLEQAKALGTKLIVAVNDDASVARLKGPERPVNSLAQRMTVLAGLRAVDWVVPFSEDTPERIISAISPHILVKGGDYKADEIAGAKQVKANGGEVKILSFIDDQSTSSIIKRIKEK